MMGERAMATTDLEANKAIARQFIQAINDSDYAAMERLLHPDFMWVTAVVADDAPNILRAMQSNTLRGLNLRHAKPRMNQQESLAAFKHIFGGAYGAAMSGEAVDETATSGSEAPKLTLRVLGLTAEEDRVAMEADSYLENKATGRTYNNFYHYFFKIRDGQLTLYKEYQDTLHLFDLTAD